MKTQRRKSKDLKKMSKTEKKKWILKLQAKVWPSWKAPPTPPSFHSYHPFSVSSSATDRQGQKTYSIAHIHPFYLSYPLKQNLREISRGTTATLFFRVLSITNHRWANYERFIRAETLTDIELGFNKEKNKHINECLLYNKKRFSCCRNREIVR